MCAWPLLVHLYTVYRAQPHIVFQCAAPSLSSLLLLDCPQCVSPQYSSRDVMPLRSETDGATELNGSFHQQRLSPLHHNLHSRTLIQVHAASCVAICCQQRPLRNGLARPASSWRRRCRESDFVDGWWQTSVRHHGRLCRVCAQHRRDEHPQLEGKEAKDKDQAEAARRARRGAPRRRRVRG